MSFLKKQNEMNISKFAYLLQKPSMRPISTTNLETFNQRRMRNSASMLQANQKVLFDEFRKNT